MPTPTFQPPQGPMDTAQLQDWIIKLIRDLNFMLGNLDTLNVNRLDAKVIIAQTITALQIAANTITADKMNVTQLSAIAANLGTITAGIIYGAYIATPTGYPRTEMSTTANLLGAYQSATNYVSIEPSSFSGNPGLRFHSPLGDGIWRILDNFLSLLTPIGSFHIQLGSGSDLFLTANNAIKLEGASLTMDGFAGYSGSFSVITGVNFVAQTTTSKTITLTKGIVTNVV